VWVVGDQAAPATHLIPVLPDASGEHSEKPRADGSGTSSSAPDPSEPTTGPLKPVAGLVLKGRYRLDAQIGSGGMGIVFRATDLEAARLGRRRREEVAVKVLKIDLRELEATLFDEVDKTRQVRHENIVDVYDFEANAQSSFIVMELLGGLPLYEFVTRFWPQGMPLPLALPYIKQMGAALTYAHGQGLVHSDVKPPNVMIHGDRVKVLDFGIARMVRAADTTGQTTGSHGERPLGLTDEFASCEMLELRPADKRDDVFCFGLVVYFLLSGKHPFDGVNALDARASKLRVPRIRALTRGQNAALQRALRFDQDRRTASIKEFVEQLQHQPLSIQTLLGAALGIAVLAALPYVWLTSGAPNPANQPTPASAPPGPPRFTVLVPVPTTPAATPRQPTDHTPAPPDTPPTPPSTSSSAAPVPQRSELGGKPPGEGDEQLKRSRLVKQLLELFHERMMQGRILEPAEDSAKSYLKQLQSIDPNSLDTQLALESFQERTLWEAESAVRRKDYSEARRWLQEAHDADASPEEIDSITREIPAEPQPAASFSASASSATSTSSAATMSSSTTTPTTASCPPTVTSKRIRDIKPDYPPKAKEHRLSGQVTVTFTINPDGTTANVIVTAAKPTGIFDQAAIRAVRKWLYPPFEGEGCTYHIDVMFNER